MLPHRPTDIRQLDRRIGRSLAVLGAMEGLARSTVIGVVPLITLDALGTKTRVSVAYFAGAFIAMLVTLNLGTIERRLSRKWTVSAGLAAGVAGSGLFVAFRSPVLAVGIGLQAIAASIFSVGLSLYIMDFIAKRELTRNESRRMVYTGAAWLAGPSLGIWLWDNVGESAPFVASMVITLGTAAFFWYLRLSAYPVLSPAKSQASNPRDTIPRFMSQKHLRISYVIVMVRAIFWVAVFVYGPIYVREAGLPNWVSGAFLSGVSVLLFFAPAVQWFVGRYGVRAVVIVSFALIAAGMTGLTLLSDPRAFGLVFWAVGAVGAGAIDVVGNVPFMRLVKPRERVPMTTVFATWRQVSALATPAIAALVLLVFPFSVFYASIAALSLWAITATSYLPKRLA